MRTRILMLNFEFPPIGGGAGNANYYLLKEFSRRPDLQIDLVTSSPNNQPELEHFSKNISIHKLNVKKKDLRFWRMSEIIMWLWKAYWFSKKLTETRKYTLCHCWFGWPAGIIGYLLRKKLSYIVALRGSDVPGYNSRLKFLDRILLRHFCRIVWGHAKAIIANSKYLRQLAEESYSKQRIRVIYNGVDITEFEPPVASSRVALLFVGRLISRKGVIYLLRAFKELVDQYGDFKLTIAGDGPERRYLQLFCREENLGSRANFLGTVDRKDIPRLYQQASIFILPSLKESLANVILEAMASGLPIITTDTGAAELVDGNGFVVEAHSHKQIKQAVEEYAANPELLKEHGQQSRRIAEKLSWDKAAASYSSIYETMK